MRWVKQLNTSHSTLNTDNSTLSTRYCHKPFCPYCGYSLNLIPFSALGINTTFTKILN